MRYCRKKIKFRLPISLLCASIGKPMRAKPPHIKRHYTCTKRNSYTVILTVPPPQICFRNFTVTSKERHR
jgi:hypothetical protein